MSRIHTYIHNDYTTPIRKATEMTHSDSCDATRSTWNMHCLRVQTRASYSFMSFCSPFRGFAFGCNATHIFIRKPEFWISCYTHFKWHLTICLWQNISKSMWMFLQDTCVFGAHPRSEAMTNEVMANWGPSCELKPKTKLAWTTFHEGRKPRPSKRFTIKRPPQKMGSPLKRHWILRLLLSSFWW